MKTLKCNLCGRPQEVEDYCKEIYACDLCCCNEPDTVHPLIYLASPYSHPDTRVRDGRFDAVCAAAARFMTEGHLIFSPIAHTHPIAMRGKLPTDWALWKKYDHAQLDAATELWVLQLPGWMDSKGVKGEIDYMDIANKPVNYVAPTAEELALIPLCSHAKTHSIPQNSDHDDIEVCEWCGMSRSHWEQGASDWMMVDLTQAPFNQRKEGAK